jgi:hypothetical protein
MFMKKLRSILMALILIFSAVVMTSNANAGQLSSSAGVSVTWDDATLYQPSSSCSGYLFNYTAAPKVLFADIEITNRYNDKIGSAIIFGGKSGIVSVQVCPNQDFTGTKVALIIKGGTGGSDDVVSTPITLISRSTTGTTAPSPTVTVTAKPAPAPTVTVTAQPAPAPTVTVTAQPAPAPTVTVTAQPAPAPTVYLTDPSDRNLSELVKSLKREVTSLKAKLKKICSAKPKPKKC